MNIIRSNFSKILAFNFILLIISACNIEDPVTTTTTSTSPEISIISPVAGSTSFDPGVDVVLTATCTDKEDGDITGDKIQWSSSSDGSLGSGNTITVNNLSIGLHMIIVNVTDSEGLTGTSAIIISIINPGTEQTDSNNPLVFINNDGGNISIEYGNQLTLTGISQDNEDGVLTGESLVWSSNIDGVLGTGEELIIDNLTLNSHIITLTATDSDGLTGTYTLLVTVLLESNPPVVNILSPSNSGTAVTGTEIIFKGEVVDSSDGVLSGESLVWSSSMDGQIGTGTLFTLNDLTINTHIITLTATDSDGEIATDVITVTVVIVEVPVNHSGVISANETWLAADNPHIVTGNITVAGAAPNGAVLTVEPGVIVRFNAGYSIVVGSTNQPGSIVAEGTLDLPILFTSNQLYKTEGWWDNIKFTGTDAGSVLNYCEIEYGGGDSYYLNHGAINITGAVNVSLTNSTITNSLYHGIYYTGDIGAIHIDNCNINNNRNMGVVLYANQIQYMSQGNDFSGNDDGGLHVFSSTVSDDATWYNFNTNYVLENITVADISGVVLTIDPGSDLRFTAGSTMDISTNGNLQAIGTAGSTILFTSNQTTKTRGWWDHIRFLSDSNGGSLDYCTIEYAGAINTSGQHNGNVVIWGADNVSISNSTISNGNLDGLFFVDESGSVTLSNNIITGNALSGIGLCPNQVIGIDSATQVTGNDSCGVYVRSGTISDSATWYPLDSFYIVENLYVTDSLGVVLTINPGTELRFVAGATIDVGTNGYLIAEGTEPLPILFTSNQTTKTRGWWDHIRFLSDSTGGSLDYCTIEYAGAINTSGQHNGNVVIYGADNVSISNSTISNGNLDGLFFVNESGSVALLNNIITGNTLSGIGMFPNQVIGIDPATQVTGNDYSGVYVRSGTISDSATWYPLDSFYIVENLYVNDSSGVILTIEPGTELRFVAGATIDVGTNGYLRAEGTGPSPILFTSNQTTKTRGWWDHIRFLSDSTGGSLDYCTIEYAGAINTSAQHNGNVVIYGADNVSISNSTISNGNLDGLFFVNESGSVTLTNNVFTGNALSGIGLYPNQMSGIDSQTNVTGNDYYGVYIRSGTVSDSTTWHDLGEPYVVDNITITGASGCVLTLLAGVEIRFNEACWIDVVSNGTLIANGTSINPIIFTSNQVDKSNGWWDYIRFTGDAVNCELSFCVVEYGGGDTVYTSRQSNLIIETNNDVSIENCRVENSIHNGINILLGDNHSLESTYFSGNVDTDLQVEAGAGYIGEISLVEPFIY